MQQGYVDFLLHHELGVRVLGVESESARVLKARSRHVKECGKECSQLQYLVWQLQDDKETVLQAGAVVEQLVETSKQDTEKCACRIASNNSGEDMIATDTDVSATGEAMAHSMSASSSILRDDRTSVTLLGLHACADLSPTMIRLFMCCSKISSMVLLSCCYHKLKLVKFEEANQGCCSGRTAEEDSETDAEMPRLSETSEGYESDVSDDCDKHNRSPQTRPKFVPIQNSFRTNAPPPKVPCRRLSDPKCLFKNFPLSRFVILLLSCSF